MGARRRHPEIDGNFAVYLGKTRKFPNSRADILVEEGGVYEIDVISPGFGYTFYQVRVRTLNGEVYIPYSASIDIWEDWMPYRGEVIE